MRRINTGANRNPAIDLYGSGKHGFKTGNRSLGDPPSTPGAEWYNAVQEELARAIEGAGIALDATKFDQLFSAIKAIAWGAGKSEAPWLSKAGGTMTGGLYVDGGAGANTGIKGDTDQDTGWEWPSDGVLQAIVNSAKRVELNATTGATSLWTHNGYRLTLQADGNLAWYNAANVVQWSSNTTYSKTDSDARFAALTHAHTTAQITGLDTALAGKINKAGDTMTGILYASSGAAGGIRCAGDNDTGFAWPVDGTLQELVDNVVRSKTVSADQSRRFYNGGFETTLQSDGNIVVRNASGAVVSDLYGRAPLASPALTGTPTAPTAAAGTNSTQLATTAFVQNEFTARKYISSDLSWAAAASITINHNLNTDFPCLDFYLRCIVANNGYAVGDVVAIGVWQEVNGVNEGLSFYVSSANAIVVTIGNSSISDFMSKTGGGPVIANAAQWRLIVKVTV